MESDETLHGSKQYRVQMVCYRLTNGGTACVETLSSSYWIGRRKCVGYWKNKSVGYWLYIGHVKPVIVQLMRDSSSVSRIPE